MKQYFVVLAAVVHAVSSPGQLVPVWIGQSNIAGANFGRSLSHGGDVNGDGFDDILVGAHYGEKVVINEGLAYVYHGSVTGPDTTLDWIHGSGQYGAEFGWAVAGNGDLNGDGFDDVVIGAPFYDAGQTDEGAVFVFLGSPLGLGQVPSMRLEKHQANARFGSSVAIPGDVNGDGFDDVLVGAAYYDDGQVNEGAAFLYHGNSNGLDSVPSWTFQSDQGNAYAYVHRIDDVNADGFADVMITSPLYDSGEVDEGKAFLFLGSASGPALTPQWTFDPDDNYSYLNAAASVGDVNADGYTDVIIGAWGFGPGIGTSVGDGGVFVFAGGPAGLSSSPTWTKQENGFGGSEYGFAAGPAGDVNGDGFADVIVGAHKWWNGQYQEGKCFVYPGSVNGVGSVPLWEQEMDQSYANYGRAATGDLDTNGDGIPEWLIGAYGYENGHSNEGGAFLYEYALETAIIDPATSPMERIGLDVIIGPRGAELVATGPEPFRLELIDIQGRVLQLQDFGSGTSRIHCGPVATGCYVVRVSNSSGTLVERFLIE
ncbi:MAG: FG-GAP repeat protein [Flavobacteriales bacterium]|nr:FG-GAP repeat protein [Flavobacteriales bacterium]